MDRSLPPSPPLPILPAPEKSEQEKTPEVLLQGDLESATSSSQEVAVVVPEIVQVLKPIEEEHRRAPFVVQQQQQQQRQVAVVKQEVLVLNEQVTSCAVGVKMEQEKSEHSPSTKRHQLQQSQQL